MGALGAAIATAVSYFEVWAFRYWHSKKYVRIKINLCRDILSYVILALQSILLLCNLQTEILYVLEGVCFIIILVLYFQDIFLLLNKGKKAITKTKEGETC